MMNKMSFYYLPIQLIPLQLLKNYLLQFPLVYLVTLWFSTIITIKPCSLQIVETIRLQDKVINALLMAIIIYFI